MTSDEKSDTIHPLAIGLPTGGPDIERRSHQIIDERLAAMDLDPTVLPIARRVIHSTADFSFAGSLRVHPRAIERAAGAISAHRPIVCDVRMVQAGITKTGCEILCAISDPEVVRRAEAQGCTRSAAAVEFLAERIDGAIVAIGNAPTALWKILELSVNGVLCPAVVVGLPVGFVGAAESKQALMESDLCYVSNVGPRGGSPVAAAVVNALAVAAKNSGVAEHSPNTL
ncbi:MAG: precorrin-8X methylmutase [Planctomycetota bacterium]|jgi:precorrin-8X/cobalt-precorrin-8 methylmutase